MSIHIPYIVIYLTTSVNKPRKPSLTHSNKWTWTHICITKCILTPNQYPGVCTVQTPEQVFKGSLAANSLSLRQAADVDPHVADIDSSFITAGFAAWRRWRLMCILAIPRSRSGVTSLRGLKMGLKMGGHELCSYGKAGVVRVVLFLVSLFYLIFE